MTEAHEVLDSLARARDEAFQEERQRFDRDRERLISSDDLAKAKELEARFLGVSCYQ
jgi:hypothetical protein